MILLYRLLIDSPYVLVWHLLVVVRSCGFAFGWILNLLVPKYCRRAIEFYCQMLSNQIPLWQCLQKGLSWSIYVVSIANYVVLQLQLRHVPYSSVVGFMYWSICIWLLGLLSGLNYNVEWFLGTWSHSGCSCSGIWRNGIFISLLSIMVISGLRLSLTAVAF